MATSGTDQGGNGEDSEDSSSSLSLHDENDIEKGKIKKIDLDEFRQKWQKELQNKKPENLNEENKRHGEESDDDKAKSLFMQGIELEKKGKVFEATRLYRRAIQLVPDIEFKIYETTKTQQNIVKGNSGSSSNNNNISIDSNDEKENIPIKINNEQINDEDDDENLDGVDLMARFKAAIQKSGRLIEGTLDKSVITSGAQFSDLPTEIILYILRWVVSSDLDLRSLEICSSICKGMYICGRDNEIWRQACIKVWGINTGTLKASNFGSWREMFIERPRVHFNGCYISKTSYLRYGENSFQDAFYRPVQIVEYFRYFRFFPDGQVLVMTASEDPAQSVGKLKNKNVTRHDILRGHYRLHYDVVIICLKRTKTHQKFDFGSRSRRGNSYDSDSNFDTFYIEFNILSSSKRRFCQLQWKNYSIIQIKNKIESTTNFNLSATKYPPLWFSRVKSYHAEADAPLQ